MAKKGVSRKIRFVKAGHPEIEAYFTPESIAKYDPARAGWIREDSPDMPPPQDVVNFMDAKPREVLVKAKKVQTIEDFVGIMVAEAGDLGFTLGDLLDALAKLGAIPETEDEPDPEQEDPTNPPPRDFQAISTRDIAGMLSDITTDELLNIVKNDSRKTAVKLASDEIAKREAK